MKATRKQSGGFTLIEIGIVFLILGLLTTFILVVSMQGIEVAKERATQSLIAKIDTLVNDRLQLLLSQHVDANMAHRFLADPTYIDPTKFPQASQRADIIARADYIKAQMPDVFFIQVDPATLSATSGPGVYPLNFAGYFPKTPVSPISMGGTISFDCQFNYTNSSINKYILPLGNNVQFDTNTSNYGAFAGNPSPGWSSPTGIGIYGAAYSAAAGLLKNLGTASEQAQGMPAAAYLPAGYNGVDDDGNGYVDDFSEGVNSTNFPAVQKCLQNHRHSTARAEALYAFLIESSGALVGRDSFKASEIADTDGDGMPEFVDAWGKPLLFFRWPAYYNSDVQRGVPWDGATDFQGTTAASASVVLPYQGSYSDQRDTNPLDPSGLLVSPIWWSYGRALTDIQYPGSKAAAFQQMFFPLVDPNAASAALQPNADKRWDRTGFFRRREFFTRFLILSAGPNGAYGVPMLTDGDLSELDPTTRFATNRYNNPDFVTLDITLVENQARPFTFNWGGNTAPYSVDGGILDSLRVNPGKYLGGDGRRPTVDVPAVGDPGLIWDGQDDISNHNLRVSGAASR